jgi:hypothetical protein
MHRYREQAHSYKGGNVRTFCNALMLTFVRQILFSFGVWLFVINEPVSLFS